jgi:hypothetical protein
VGLEVGGCVSAGRRADVAALEIADHEQPGRPRVLAHVLERAHAVGAELLEEGALRLDGDCVGAGRVDQAAAEARVRRRGRLASGVGVAAELDGEQVEARIEPDDELAAPLDDGGREPVGERSGRHSCLGLHQATG